jgi:hypothetical protein
MLFGGSLEKLYEMDVQRRNWTGKVPQVVVALCEKFIQAGGCRTEGVFRLAAGTSAINAAKVGLERGV